RAGERVRQRRLADAGEILDQQVPAGREADQHLVEDVVLAADRLAHVRAQPVEDFFRLGDFRRLDKVAHGKNLTRFGPHAKDTEAAKYFSRLTRRTLRPRREDPTTR